jgi:hypothetical protein
MAYTITKSNGDTLTTVPDTETNTDYGITLVGRNYSGYGIYLNDNFVSLMENFAKSTAPAQPLEGQLWWNTSSMELQVWEGTVWKRLGHVTSSSIAPGSTGRAIGDLWWDTTNQQLKAWAGEVLSNVVAQFSTTQYIVGVASTDNVRVGDLVTTGNVLAANAVTVTQILSSSNVRVTTPATIYSTETVRFTRGSGWNVIGPSYTKDQQITGIFPKTIIDDIGATHVVGVMYQKGQIVGTVSRDNQFAPRTQDAIDRLPIVKPGVTLIEDVAPQQVRSVSSNVAGAAGSTVIVLSNTDGLAVGDTVISSNISISASKTIQEIYSNSAIRINATDFFTQNEVITFQRGADESNLFHGTSTNAQRLNGKTSDLFATLSTEQWFRDNLAVAGNIYVGSNSTPAVGKTVLWQTGANLNIINTQANGNIAISTSISGIASPVEVFTVNGITGLASVRGIPTTANGVATKSYVDNSQGIALSALTANITALINGAAVNKRDFGNVAIILDTYANNFTTVDSTLALKSNTASPAFTGAPTAPTPSFGSNSTSIATTAFVANLASYIQTEARANAALAVTAIQARANIASPVFTGTPASSEIVDLADRSTRIATTKFVGDVVAAANSVSNSGLTTKAPLNNPALTGIPTGPTASNVTYTLDSNWVATKNLVVNFSGANQSSLATIGFVANVLSLMPFPDLTTLASKASPVLTGIPTAPNAPAGTVSQQLATTRFVAENSPVLSVNGATGTVILGVSGITGAAPINSPVFTGTPVLTDNPPAGDDTKKIPTTEWVRDITDLLAPRSSPTFIGTVTVPTPSSVSDTTVAASTAWVKARIASADVPKWGGANKYVSTLAPTVNDGVNGDLWFKYTV